MYINNNDVKIHYVKNVINEEKTFVCFIPGAVQSAEDFDAVLKKNNFQQNYIVISLRGRGKSDAPKRGYSLLEQASDIQAVLNAEKENDFVLYAHSVGVPICIKAVADFNLNCKALVLSEFAPFYPPFDKNWADWVKKQKINTIHSNAIDGLVADENYVDVSKELKAIKQPKYLLVGNNQNSALRAKEKEHLKNSIPQLNLIEINAGHELLEENPKETFHCINEAIANA